jgi:hypothetical protein
LEFFESEFVARDKGAGKFLEKFLGRVKVSGIEKKQNTVPGRHSP